MTPERLRPRRVWWIVGSVVALGVIGAVVGYVSSRSSTRAARTSSAGTAATSPATSPATSQAPESTVQPSPNASAAGVPLIVDTDIFADVDDVGALTTAFALQLEGEANVVAIGISARTDPQGVATNSWKCADAISHFYTGSATPLGSDTPNDGTTVIGRDFVGPCAALGPQSTPTPDTAVHVYRRALAAQPDGSVVIAQIGYSGNLAALLSSSGDAASPLSGRDLVAKKVKTLVVMAGGYPTMDGEHNLRGNPAAAQTVSTSWPTKIVWSGWEVGYAVIAGHTISSTHPAQSPVRAAYEAYVGPDTSNWSWDLTAVYHAIRPDDPLLTEVGPGTNTIDSTGRNTFVMGAGNQYYLRLTDGAALDTALDTLLDTLPPGVPTGTTSP